MPKGKDYEVPPFESFELKGHDSGSKNDKCSKYYIIAQVTQHVKNPEHLEDLSTNESACNFFEEEGII